MKQLHGNELHSSRRVCPVETAVRDYLAALDRYDVVAALEHFTADAFYSHPPYSGNQSDPRSEVRGLGELEKLFGIRGPILDKSHEIRHSAQSGSIGFVEGIVLIKGVCVSSFVSIVKLSEEGKISEYEAYKSSPPVGQTVSEPSIKVEA